MQKPWFKSAFGSRQPSSWQGAVCALALVVGLLAWSMLFFGVGLGATLSRAEQSVWLLGVIIMGVGYQVVINRKSGAQDD
jgi:hypothetical protein